jgi:hypothetical protein
MNTLFRLPILLGLSGLALAACSKEPAPPLDHVGLWESTFRGRGGESNSLVMNADSIVNRYYFKAFDFHFSDYGDSLRLEPIVPDSLLPAGDTAPPVFVIPYEIVGDTLVRTETNGREWLLREGPSPAGPNSIEGTWKTVRSTLALTAVGYHRYRSDSVLQIRLPVSTKSGVYKRHADSLTFTFPDDTSRCVLALRADTMNLTRTFTNGTFTFGYRRAGDTAWYRLDEP